MTQFIPTTQYWSPAASSHAPGPRARPFLPGEGTSPGLLPPSRNASIMSADRPARHILTIDLEEHFHASRFDSPMRRRYWSYFDSRIHKNTEHLLDVLARRSTKATFFVLGWLAERYPSLIRTIAASGHEIACLGYAHEPVAAQTPEQFRQDIRRAKQLLEDVIGQPVWGFRAPAFSITADTSWALAIVADCGFLYDSSVLPVGFTGNRLYSGNGIQRLPAGTRSIWEISPATSNMLGFRVPIGGGGYLRTLHYPVLRTLFSQIEDLGESIVLYMRAWELDYEQPRMEGPLLAEFSHYLNLHKMEPRLTQLLTDFSFGSARDTIQPVQALEGYPDPLDDSESANHTGAPLSAAV
jgi:polysaccharide deacetylase family protein (PEP-CTERM system associated)